MAGYALSSEEDFDGIECGANLDLPAAIVIWRAIPASVIFNMIVCDMNRGISDVREFVSLLREWLESGFIDFLVTATA
jgi:hypothetical protein